MAPVGEAARTFPEANQGYRRTALAEDLGAAGSDKEAELFQAAPDGQTQQHGTSKKKERQFSE